MQVDMAVQRRRRLSLTSLIDVIFLLLLFFMLSSTFTRFGEIEIAAGRVGEAQATTQAPDIFIRLAANNSWKVNGAELSADSAVSELARLEGTGARSAVLTVREKVTSQALIDALERIERTTKLRVGVTK